jgi:hypothetical protein
MRASVRWRFMQLLSLSEATSAINCRLLLLSALTTSLSPHHKSSLPDFRLTTSCLRNTKQPAVKRPLASQADTHSFAKTSKRSQPSSSDRRPCILHFRSTVVYAVTAVDKEIPIDHRANDVQYSTAWLCCAVSLRLVVYLACSQLLHTSRRISLDVVGLDLSVVKSEITARITESTLLQPLAQQHLFHFICLALRYIGLFWNQ